MPQTDPHARNLRLGRYSELGRAYHVTTTTLHQAAVFADFLAARTLIQCLKSSDDLARSETLAFVVMPTHLHWLFVLKAGNLAEVVGAVKSVSAHRLGRRLWQPGYFDHGIRRDEDLRGVARYIIANPVRARLVEQVGDYPHWDAMWL
ncbi:transposase [uncultured Thiodictyon sp.]|uniref:REP-associated tyrosine transposase n=1 Tax=uncultured Thiodictyon sp. TaxID=1846217 RepID=UPI0025FC6CA9|nr:transposase [uncultured Thiodictyon sp.]